MYKSKGVKPSDTPEKIFDLYSVPIFLANKPEVIKGKEIGSTKQSIETGDVLLCKINPHINRVWEIVELSQNQRIASSEWIVVRNQNIDPTYLKYYFESPGFRKLLCSQVSGVGGSLTRAQPSVVKNYPVAIPPLREQLVITKAIKRYFELINEITINLSN